MGSLSTIRTAATGREEELSANMTARPEAREAEESMRVRVVQPVKWPCVRGGNDATSLQFFSATDMGLVACRNHCAEGGYPYFGASCLSGKSPVSSGSGSGSDELEKSSFKCHCLINSGTNSELDNVDGIPADFDDCGGGYKPQSSVCTGPSETETGKRLGAADRISVYYTYGISGTQHEEKMRKENDQAAQDELQCTDDATVSSDREACGISAAELSDRKMITDRIPLFLETSKLLPQTTSGFYNGQKVPNHTLFLKMIKTTRRAPSGCSKSALMVCVGVLQRVQV